MKVNLIQSYNNNYCYKDLKANIKKTDYRGCNCITDYCALPFYIPDISFKKSNAEKVLKTFTNHVGDAYSGYPMLREKTVKEIFQKLDKRPNAQAAINLLNNYTKYLYRIESQIYEIILDAPYKHKKTFDEILKQHVPGALTRLREKESYILHSTDDFIKELSNGTRHTISQIRDYSLKQVEDDTFRRGTPLGLIQEITVCPEEDVILRQIYRTWFRLPHSFMDEDAFIVENSKMSHTSIAKRLISVSEESVEHIKLQKNNGSDDMENLLLTSRGFNHERGELPMDEFSLIMLPYGINVPNNIQMQMNQFIRGINVMDPLYTKISWYPDKVKETILKQSNGLILLDTSKLNLSKRQKKENNCVNRLSEKYIVKPKE